jgi:hypothetical protein
MRLEYVRNKKDEELIREMASVGISQEQIAAVVDISVDTLKKYYPYELATARTKANNMIAGALFRKAVSGNVTAQIFWLKTRAGWRESIEIVETRAELSATPLTEEEWLAKYQKYQPQ